MHISRKEFLKLTAFAAATIGIAPSLLAQSQGQINELGIILGTLKNEMKEDPEGTLAALAELGYTHVEAGDRFVKKPKKYVKLLNKYGLKNAGCGASLWPVTQDLDGTFERAAQLETKYFTCFWPWLDSATELTKDKVDKVIEEWIKVGTKAKETGMRFAIHNHEKEFVALEDGTLVYDYILQNTDADLITMEMDLYWVKYAGADPVEYFKKYPGRFELLHVKDMADDEEKSKTCVGDGIIDFAEIFAHSEIAGVKQYIVEQEGNTSGMKCAIDSYNHLKGLRF